MDMVEMTLIAWSQKSNEPHQEWVLHDMLLISWSGSRMAVGSDRWLMAWFGSMPRGDLIFYLGHPATKQLGRNRFSTLTGLVTISNNFRKILKGWDRKTCLWAFLWYIKAHTIFCIRESHKQQWELAAVFCWHQTTPCLPCTVRDTLNSSGH